MLGNVEPIRNKAEKLREKTLFVSVVFELCSSFKKTATSQKTGANLYLLIPSRLSTMNMAAVNGRQKLSVLILYHAVVQRCSVKIF